MRRILLLALALLFAALLTAGCGAYGERYTGEADAAAEGDEPRITDEPFDEAAREAAGCGEVEELDEEGAGHTQDIDEPVEYETNPPTSGRHFQETVPWGIYSEQQRDVQTVHNMEHGHIVISYKGLSDEQEEELLEQVRVNPFHLLLQPREDNPKDGVYYSAWTVQLYCEEPSAEALQHMIDNHRDQGPELFVNDESMGLDEG